MLSLCAGPRVPMSSGYHCTGAAARAWRFDLESSSQPSHSLFQGPFLRCAPRFPSHFPYCCVLRGRSDTCYMGTSSAYLGSESFRGNSLPARALLGVAACRPCRTPGLWALSQPLSRDLLVSICAQESDSLVFAVNEQSAPPMGSIQHAFSFREVTMEADFDQIHDS